VIAAVRAHWQNWRRRRWGEEGVLWRRRDRVRGGEALHAGSCTRTILIPWLRCVMLGNMSQAFAMLGCRVICRLITRHGAGFSQHITPLRLALLLRVWPIDVDVMHG
jgi:hypothetical protein